MRRINVKFHEIYLSCKNFIVAILTVGIHIRRNTSNSYNDSFFLIHVYHVVERETNISFCLFSQKISIGGKACTVTHLKALRCYFGHLLRYKKKFLSENFDIYT
jgi:hypothetical protein